MKLKTYKRTAEGRIITSQIDRIKQHFAQKGYMIRRSLNTRVTWRVFHKQRFVCAIWHDDGWRVSDCTQPGDREQIQNLITEALGSDAAA